MARPFKAAAVLAISALLAWSAPPDRIRAASVNRFVRVPGSVHRRVAVSNDRGVLDSATRITGLRLILKPSAAQQAALDQLLEDQRDPASPNYQKWFTPKNTAISSAPARAIWQPYPPGSQPRDSPWSKPRALRTGSRSAAQPAISAGRFVPKCIAMRATVSPILQMRPRFRSPRHSQMSSTACMG